MYEFFGQIWPQMFIPIVMVRVLPQDFGKLVVHDQLFSMLHSGFSFCLLGDTGLDLALCAQSREENAGIRKG